MPGVLSGKKIRLNVIKCYNLCFFEKDISPGECTISVSNSYKDIGILETESLS